jgi:2-dehydropantoate 2-reductase
VPPFSRRNAEPSNPNRPIAGKLGEEPLVSGAHGEGHALRAGGAGDRGEPRGPFVVGLGEVGRRLLAALDAAGAGPRAVTRLAGWEATLDLADPPARIVAVREEELTGIWQRFEPALRPRLVLVQNGFIETLAGTPGEPGAVARGLIWFTAKGGFFRELRPSLFWGAAAAPVAAALARGGLATRVASDSTEFRRELVLKGVWNAVVGLPLAAHGVDLATYRRAHAAELAALVDESCRAASAEYGVAVDGDDALARLDATTGELGWVRGGVRALEFRNGAIARFGRKHGVPTPVTDRLLGTVGYAAEARA